MGPTTLLMPMGLLAHSRASVCASTVLGIWNVGFSTRDSRAMLHCS